MWQPIQHNLKKISNQILVQKQICDHHVAETSGVGTVFLRQGDGAKHLLALCVRAPVEPHRHDQVQPSRYSRS